MRITITLPDYPPAIFAPSWEALEALIRSCYVDERDIRMTRISRDDKGANYRAPGAYTFELNHDYESIGTVKTDR